MSWNKVRILFKYADELGLTTMSELVDYFKKNGIIA